jgi:hypothetical protein
VKKITLKASNHPNLPFRVEDQTITKDTHGNAIAAEASSSNHFVLVNSHPVLYCEQNGTRIWRLAKIPEEAMTGCVDLIKELLASHQNAAIVEINNQPAAECKLAQAFLRNGFRLDGTRLVWPSN